METLFFHGKTTDGRRFTIAGKFTQRGKILKKDILLLGASLCSTNDSFVKKVGRYKAEGRLNSTRKSNRGKTEFNKVDVTSPIKSFIEKVSTFNKMTSRGFQKIFNLNHSI